MDVAALFSIAPGQKLSYHWIRYLAMLVLLVQSKSSFFPIGSQRPPPSPPSLNVCVYWDLTLT